MNGNFKRRFKKAEQRLSMGHEPLVINVTDYSSGPLPADIRQDEIPIHFMHFEQAQANDVQKDSNEA
jgi:hypothetical protein